MKKNQVPFWVYVVATCGSQNGLCLARWGGGEQPQPKFVGLGLDLVPCGVYVATTCGALLRNFGEKIASVGPDRRVESKLNHNLLGWGWIGLHFGSMLWPLGTFLGLNPF